MKNVNWVEPATALPIKGRLCVIKRKNSIYLGSRYSDSELVINPDFSRNCHWFGNPIDSDICETPYDYHFAHNFQDGTVIGWAYLVDSII